LSPEWQQDLAPWAGQETEEADAHEARRKHMKKEAPQKLLCGDRHELLLAAMRGKRTRACTDLESSLLEKLEPNPGPSPSTIVFEQSLERVAYDSTTRHVAVTLRDGNRFQYFLPVANRPGVRDGFEQPLERGRVARVSRLMALAIKFQRLVDEGAIRNYAELAAFGHVARSRLCQILMLANLAPTIQEALLFLPRTVCGADCVTENRLRRIARLVDWEAQKRLFRSYFA
jgi:hypothetical protein